MSKNRKQEPEYHFVATNIDYKINSESKKILAGNWCLLHSIKKIKTEDNSAIAMSCSFAFFAFIDFPFFWIISCIVYS